MPPTTPAATTVEDPPPPSPLALLPSLCPILLLPDDTLQHIFSRLPLRQILASRSVCRHFREALSSLPFLSLLPPLRLLALRHPRHHHHHQQPPSLLTFDPSSSRWLRFSLSFLPFLSVSPVTASSSLLYLWADPHPPSNSSDSKPPKSLVLCNPLTRSFRILPPLGSAWSRHGTVLAAPPSAGGAVLVLTELAALSYSPGAASWCKFSLNLPSKPRSPVFVGDSIFTLCDIGNPWRSQWKLFSCAMSGLGGPRGWIQLERHEWGDVFDILKRPRLVRGSGNGRILMIGGLRSSFAVDAPCSTVLILRLDLASMEWEEAGRMPPEMYRCFAGVSGQGTPTPASAAGNNKVKVFGGDGKVWFSGKRVRGKMAMWVEGEEEVVKGTGLGGIWKWVDGAPGYGEGVYRGFVFDVAVTKIP
ncbi:SKP1-interacting partner 15 [Apostasia shenzhenica]|uniref:SKP1-interacting partner 15 n=1 Tax=Apostasia shenzhenica TaxID=1088818 RepID=A0A2H9ZUN7_9ASPA|nr:SKP1-interacting partner 15 [Apostasia shenzhenica]